MYVMQGSEIVLTDEVECFWLSGASADRGPLFPEPRRSPSQVCEVCPDRPLSTLPKLQMEPLFTA